MKPKFAWLMVCLALSLFAKINEASAVLINFDELVADTVYASLNYPDVSFTNTAGNLIVKGGESGYPGPPFSSPISILPVNYVSANLTRATFTSGLDVDFVSVVLGDFNDDADDIFLKAYDSSDNLIATVGTALPADLFGGATLGVFNLAGGISYVEFWGEGLNGSNSAYFDNFEYQTADVNGTVVPEPATLSLFGLGLFGWMFSKKRSR